MAKPLGTDFAPRPADGPVLAAPFANDVKPDAAPAVVGNATQQFQR